MDLSRFDNSSFDPGAGLLRRAAWYFFNAWVLDSWWLPFSAPKRLLLRAFGARIGRRVVIKPRVNIKSPWRLAIGDHSWIGEGVWIDNLVQVEIGSHACVSQGAFLLTGNHDYRSETFALVTAPVRIGDRAWVGAKAVVCPGVAIATDSVLVAGSVARRDTEVAWIYHGSPAVKLRPRYRPPVRLVDAQDHRGEVGT